MKRKILFIERKASGFVSIENVFRQVASALPYDRFETAFQKLKYGNDVVSLIKNILFFKPDTGDIYHITGHIHYISLLLPPSRTVLTIHDLGFLHTRQGIRRTLLKKLLLDWPLRRLKYVTVVSDFTKREVLEHCETDESKIRVIENPLAGHLIPGDPKPFNSLCPTILQIGTMENKNIPRLAEALRGLKCKLRIIGPLDDNIRGALAAAGTVFENVSDLYDSAMTEEYRNADIITFCSTYEGFGLPVIEGQAMRKPVITSNVSPLKEVAGDGAVVVDPFDIAAIRSGIDSIIASPGLRESLIEKGMNNIKRFETTSVAMRYAELYQEIASNNEW